MEVASATGASEEALSALGVSALGDSSAARIASFPCASLYQAEQARVTLAVSEFGAIRRAGHDPGGRAGSPVCCCKKRYSKGVAFARCGWQDS